MTASLWFSRITPSFNWSLLRLVGAKNHNIPTAPRKEPGSPNSEPPKFWCLATARKTLRPHAGPQGDSTHFQFTASTIEFTLFLLQVGMCFCPFHTTASVWIHMQAANLAPIQFSCSFPTYQPPIPSMTAVAYGNSAFGIRLVKLIPSFTWDAQYCFETFSLAVLVTAPIWACCSQAHHVFSSSSTFCSSHSSLWIGGTLYTVGHQSMVLEANTKKICS